ncbi:hypothetical protein [Xenorhabdus siamensis]|uniref:hypothetical protein n=1 Tax=Xenorhabdus siamensis TaxID=3136254 RepID=UPI0030F4AE4A
MTEKTLLPDGNGFSRRASDIYVADVLIKNNEPSLPLDRQYLLSKVSRCTAVTRSLSGYGSFTATQRRSLQAHRSFKKQGDS